MIRLREIKVPVFDDDIKKYLCKKFPIDLNDILDLKTNKKSIDARKKEIYFVYEVDISLKNEKILLQKKYKNISITPKEIYLFNNFGSKKIKKRPVIVGSGPAGLFCAYLLSENGYRPIIIERGEKIEDRVKTVSKFWKDGNLDKNSNVQFGEGGAGTFSDGKLNTLVKDKSFRMKKVFEIFVEMGAPKDILYVNKPHIGTDILRDVIINMRNKIISLGGEFRYNNLMSDINIESDSIKSIILNNKEELFCDDLVLAIGHSSRDTFSLLYNKNFNMEAKPFAVGIRVQHSQKMINLHQYGNYDLPPASYKLTHKCSNGRGVYSFCMCPGGFVVNASSEEKSLVINGMSNNDRNSGVANSAIVVTVSPKDFGMHPLDGMNFQRDLEEKTYKIGNGNIPIQYYKDFKDNKLTNTKSVQNVKFKGNYQFANLNLIMPNYITDSLKEGIDSFNSKINGFNNDDVILAAIESRTSSPVRIIRNENFESNFKGIYPAGEGAGYAGGITTSAIDGIKIAEVIMGKYAPFERGNIS